VPRGGTSSGTATFTFTENTAACLPNVAMPGALTVTINDIDGGDVTFSGTPVVTAPGSLGATASVVGNVLTINFAGSDVVNIEQVSVSGLKITAATTATAGAIAATLGGTQTACFVGGTTTATGTLGVPTVAGATGQLIALGASCPFAVTAAGGPGNLEIQGLGSENVAVTAVAAPAGGFQNVTTAPTVNAHTAGQTVQQTGVPNCLGLTLPSPGTVANVLTQAGVGAVPQVIPGENSQPARDVTLSEAPSGTATSFVNAQTVTFAITAPATGVVFSSAPTLTGPGGPVVCALSFDRRSCTATITGATAGIDTYTLTNIRLDADASVPLGTAVTLTATVSGGAGVNGAPTTIANVGRVVIGTSAQPTISIGFNDQPTGLITLTESGAGFFTAGVGGNNSFGLCLATGETFTRAPWAVVTVPGGTAPAGLSLLSGVVGASQVQGTLYNAGSCARWTVFSASTTGPATIEIRGSADNTTPLPTGANNGPRLSVPSNLQPGSTQAVILIGQQAAVAAGCPVPPFPANACAGNAAFSSVVSNAIRVFKNTVTVTAASQPNCAPGAVDCLLGNVVITETQNGQLKAGQLIFGWILPRSTTLRNDVRIKATNTNDLPIITTNSNSGLLVSPVQVICPPVLPLVQICVFAATVTQQSFGPAFGQITISNMHATVTPDAVLGPIQTEWSNSLSSLGITVPVLPGTPGQPFDSIVSNGNVGTGPVTATTKTSAASAVGKTNNAILFTVGTKVVPLVASSNNIVTVRVKVDPALVGKSVVIERAVKNANGTWGAFTKITTRTIGADGFAYYYASAHSAQWVSYRGMFAGTTVGTTQYGTSRSQAVQVRWL